MNRVLLRVALLSLAALLAAAIGCSAPPAEVLEFSPDVLLSEPDDVLVLDVRSPGEYAAGHVPNAVNSPHDQLAGRLVEIEDFRQLPVVVYCESGRRAGMATTVLADAGFVEVHHLQGDMAGWRQRSLPTERTAR